MASAKRTHVKLFLIANTTAIKKREDEYLEFRVASDKISSVVGRTQRFYCNCVGTAAGGRKYCPLHNEEPVKEEWFPVNKAAWDKIAKAASGTTHSFRRTLAATLRDSADKITTAKVAQHMGWEKKAAMWSEYTNKDWTQAKLRIPDFAPIAGLLRALKEGTTEPVGHTFLTKKGEKKKITLALKGKNMITAKTGKIKNVLLKTVYQNVPKGAMDEYMEDDEEIEEEISE
jgi:hypothetical protein